MSKINTGSAKIKESKDNKITVPKNFDLKHPYLTNLEDNRDLDLSHCLVPIVTREDAEKYIELPAWNWGRLKRAEVVDCNYTWPEK